MTDNEEGKFVADTIQEQKLRNHFNNKDFAILYRTNAQSRAFEEACAEWEFLILFMAASVFTSAKRSKIISLTCELLVNPRDEEALKRIINYPGKRHWQNNY